MVIDNMEKTIKIDDNLKEKFWDMFIIDVLIGNTDRHNGNWGILIDIKNGKRKFSPIYDCGSCLNPILDDNELDKINDFIEGITCLLSVRKSFYKRIISYRYLIIKEVYDKLS